MAMDKTLRRFIDLKEQRAETYRYWQGRPPAERFLAVWETTAEAYAISNAVKGATQYDPSRRSEATLTRVQLPRS